LSQIAREKHELELRVKKAEGAEVELKRLTEINRNLELSNVSLRVCSLLSSKSPSSSSLSHVPGLVCFGKMDDIRETDR